MKVLVVLSGGQDSTTCLFMAKSMGAELHAITFDYGQRHRQEVEAAQQIAGMAGVDRDNHELVNLFSVGGGSLLQGTSPLISGQPLEQYKDHASLPGGLEKTFVPMRNQLFLTIAMNRAAVIGARFVVTGVCEEDYGGYPDCRRDFIDKLELASNIGLYGSDMIWDDRIKISTPLMKMTKRHTVLESLQHPGCYAALAYSHTAYDGAYPPTGKDHATLLRAKGFEQAQVPDPLVLRAWTENLMDTPDWYKTLPIKTFEHYMNLAGLL